MTVRNATFEDMALAAGIMVTSFRRAFADFVSPETMDACTNPENCRAMLERIYREGKMHFLMGGNQGFLCWQETDDGAEIVALHSLPVSWGTGIGHAMLTEALKLIDNRPVHLWAFKENTRARRFYEKHGFRRDGTERVSEFDGALEVRYVRSGEIWDAYHPDGTLAGRDLVRGEPIPSDLRHLVSEILVRHTDGDYLLMQRDPRKPNYGGYFEATAGGSALKGEDAYRCAQRELREETGIDAGTLTSIGRFVSHNTIYETFLCVTDCDKNSVKLQKGETVSYKWVSEAEFIAFVNSDSMIDVQFRRYKPYLKQMGYINLPTQ